MSNIDKHAVQAVADLKAGYTLGHADVAILNELARIALVSLEAEAVSINDDMAYAFHHALSDSSLGADEVEEIKSGLRAAFANITAPPAPVSVPDAMDDQGGVCCEVSYADGWNACRAAMLQNGNSPAQSDCCPAQNCIAPALGGNSPVIADGWVACSERMPEKRERDIWLFDGEFVHHGYIWDGYQFVDWNEEYLQLCGVTHWMPMTMPAAPQQEAK